MDLIYGDEAYAIVGACMDVHSELGMGFLEAVYHEALEIELAERKITFEHEKPLRIMFKGKYLKKQYFADFTCCDKIIVEVKAVRSLLPDHEAQLFNYL